MKRLSFLLALVFLMGCLAGCGSTAPGAETAPAVEEAAETEGSAPVTEEAAPAAEDTAAETEETAPEQQLPEPETEYLDDFTVQTIDGGTFTLSEELEDHELVLINLWATWCEPCREEFPYLQEAWSQRSDEVSVIALSVEPNDDVGQMSACTGSLGVTFPVGNVGDTGLERFAPAFIPTTVVVDKTGRVLTAESGAKSSTEEFLEMFDRFTAEDFDPDVCTYRVFTATISAQPIQGVQLSFCTDLGCATAVSGEDGYAIFTGPPARYHIEVLSAPDNMVPYSDKEIVTDPYPQTLMISFEKGYVPVEGEDEEPVFDYDGPEPEWIILDDFTVDTADGGTFNLNETLADHKLLFIKLFSTTCYSSPWELPAMQKVQNQRGDKVAVLALGAEPSESLETLKDFADGLGVSIPVARIDGTGLEALRTENLPTTILVDNHGRVLFVDGSATNTAEDIHALLDCYSGKNYNPYECTYTFATYDYNGSIEGVVFTFTAEDGTSFEITSSNGSASFTGAPRRYHVQVTGVPEGAYASGATEWTTEPYPQTFWVPFNGAA